MRIIRRLFGKKAIAQPRRDVASLVQPLTSPALQLLQAPGSTRSYFGGDPDLPQDVPWPCKSGKRLTFVARLSLAEIAAEHRLDWLPETGALLFFYDVDEMPWGFDPKDRGSWVVVSVPDLAEPVRVQSRAGGNSIGGRSIRFAALRSMPSPDRAQVSGLKLNDAELDAFCDLSERSYGHCPKHQIGGFPQVVQADGMELECQLASNGVYCGNPAGYKSSRASELGPGAAEWRLLLQVDSDDDLGVMWGDVGMIYFWVQEHAARTRDFSNVWLVLQCC